MTVEHARGYCSLYCFILPQMQTRYAPMIYRNLGTVWNENLEDDCDIASISLNFWMRVKPQNFHLILEGQSLSLTRLKIWEDLGEGPKLLSPKALKFLVSFTFSS